MRKLTGIFLFVGIAVLLTGCIESKQVYHLNPDGSGKVAVDVLFQSMGMDMMGEDDQDPDEMLKKVAKETLGDSQGVDAWKDVSYKLTDDGRISFKGTAYFKDVTKLQLNFGGVKTEMRDFVFKQDSQGNTVFELASLSGDSKKKKKAKPAKLSEAKIKQMIKMERLKYNQSKPMLATVFAPLKIDMTFYLPGKVTKAVNFTKVNDQAVQLVFAGQKMMDVLDEMYADDALLRKEIVAGVKLMDDTSESQDQFFNEKLFGERAGIQATLSGEMKPLFDYKSEVAAAKKQYAQLVKKLGIKDKSKPAAPAKGGDFKELKVKSVNLGEEWYKLELVGELPGTVLKVSEGMLKKAIADNGEDLLPERDWDQKIHFPSLSSDKTEVQFGVKMNLPGDKVRGLKEVSGVLQYVVSDKAQKLDLGITAYNVAAKGTKLGAVIETIEESEYAAGNEDLSLKLEIAPEQLVSAVFYGQNGEELEVRKTGYFSSGDVTTFSFSCDGAFPKKGKIVVEVYEQLKEYEIPFKITNITLLGKPR